MLAAGEEALARLSSFNRALPVGADHRGAERHRVVIARVTLRRHGEQPSDARLQDLSIYGCRLAETEPHDAGERVWLRLDSGMAVGATVVWSEGGITGCRFDTPIDRAIMRSLTLPNTLSIVAGQ